MAKYFIMRGVGDGSAATGFAGGAAEDSVAWADAQKANGAPLESHTPSWSATAGSDGGGTPKVRITGSNGDFTDAILNVYARCDFAAGYADGRYKIIGLDAVNGAYIDIDLPYDQGDQSMTACVVGGALTTDDVGVQVGFDNVAAGDTIKVATDTVNATTYTLVAIVDIDVTAGTSGSPITVEAVNKDDGVRIDPDRDAMPVITTTVASLAALLRVNGASMNYYDLFYVAFNGGGSGKASNGLYLYHSTAPAYWNIVGCKIHDCHNDGVLWAVNYGTMWMCEVYENGRGAAQAGINLMGGTSSMFVGCRVHDNNDNASHGFEIAVAGVQLIDCRSYDNGAHGFYFTGAANYAMVGNCTAYGNAGAGFHWASGSIRGRVWDNIAAGNTGDGFDFDSAFDQVFFGYNLGHGNSAHYSEGADGTFAAFGQGNNLVADPLFVDPTNGDLSLGNTTLLTAGIDGRAIGAVVPRFQGYLDRTRARHGKGRLGYAW